MSSCEFQKYETMSSPCAVPILQWLGATGKIFTRKAMESHWVQDWAKPFERGASAEPRKVADADWESTGWRHFPRFYWMFVGNTSLQNE
jgi:hypothetical protein